jgi:hypothetical protein
MYHTFSTKQKFKLINKNLKLSAIENKIKAKSSHLTVSPSQFGPSFSLPSPSVDLPLSFSFSFPFPFLLSIIFPSFLFLFQTVQAVLWKTQHAPLLLATHGPPPTPIFLSLSLSLSLFFFFFKFINLQKSPINF